jgi:hypothetical protein
MAVMIDAESRASLPASKAHHLQSLKRHVSAPGRPSLALDARKTSEAHEKTTALCSSPQLRLPRTSLFPQPTLLNDLAIVQSANARLRIERNEWRTTAELRKNQISYHEQDIMRQRRGMTVLEEQNAALQTKCAQAILDKESLNTHAGELADQLNEANRNLARITKSERLKGKVQQRNLRLKATLKRISMRAMEEPTRGDVENKMALKEALAFSCERIEGLESRGEALVKELEKREDSPGGLSRAEMAFRRVINDKLSREQKEHWEDLVGE